MKQALLTICISVFLACSSSKPINDSPFARGMEFKSTNEAIKKAGPSYIVRGDVNHYFYLVKGDSLVMFSHQAKCDGCAGMKGVWVFAALSERGHEIDSLLQTFKH